MMKAREMFDREFVAWVQQEYDRIRVERKALKGRPTEEEMILLRLDKQFEAFYRSILIG